MAKKWIEEARKACDGDCAYCEYYWQEWDESGCKLDDFESEDEKKMTKEEARSSVMGAISMALKDPILQQGFEIICKNLVELEKQIEKMKCCYNCKHSRTEYEHCKTDKHEKWEMKENE